MGLLGLRPRTPTRQQRVKNKAGLIPHPLQCLDIRFLPKLDSIHILKQIHVAEISLSLDMICPVCQSILNPSQEAVATSILDEKLRIHHPSRRSLKRSVELGYYMCTRFWVSLRPADRHLISTFANSESDFEDKLDISSIGAPAESTKPFIAAFRLEDGLPYGHLGWY